MIHLDRSPAPPDLDRELVVSALCVLAAALAAPVAMVALILGVLA